MATKAYLEQSVVELEALCLDLATMAAKSGATKLSAGMGDSAGPIKTPYQWGGTFLLKIMQAMESAQ